MSEKFTFFWDGPFSQWHMGHPFKIDGVEYNCAEQWMMACKARLFKDDEALKRVMKARHPRDQKAVGRDVKGLKGGKWDAEDIALWNSKAKDFVYEGNVAKFRQHARLRAILMETRGTTLVEASPKDNVWGIGLAKDDPRAQNRETWLGTNWLGEVLTKVRNDLETQ